MSALRENACLKRMTPSPVASDAAVIKAFAGNPGLLEQAPALMARGRALDCECLFGPPNVHGGEVCAALESGLIAPQNPDALRRETLWAYMQGGLGIFGGDLYFYRVDGDLRGRVGEPQAIAPVLSEILKHSTTITKQGAHV